MKIKVALFGLGKTGKIVARSLQEDEMFDLVFAVKRVVKESDKFDFLVKPRERTLELLDKFKPDIIIDFTTPDAVMRNVNKLKKGTAYVIATTGFSESQFKKLKKYKQLKILYAASISDGINVVITLCELLNRIWHKADTEIIEQHFSEKKDLPSGTAQELAKVFGQKVPIHSVRAGGIVGVHEVILATNNQKIVIRHESFSRGVFAEGAKRAAIWLMNKPYGFYDIREVYQ